MPLERKEINTDAVGGEVRVQPLSLARRLGGTFLSRCDLQWWEVLSKFREKVGLPHCSLRTDRSRALDGTYHGSEKLRRRDDAGAASKLF